MCVCVYGWDNEQRAASLVLFFSSGLAGLHRIKRPDTHVCNTFHWSPFNIHTPAKMHKHTGTHLKQHYQFFFSVSFSLKYAGFNMYTNTLISLIHYSFHESIYQVQRRSGVFLVFSPNNKHLLRVYISYKLYPSSLCFHFGFSPSNSLMTQEENGKS